MAEKDFDKFLYFIKRKAADDQAQRNLERLTREGRIDDIRRGLHRVSHVNR